MAFGCFTFVRCSRTVATSAVLAEERSTTKTAKSCLQARTCQHIAATVAHETSLQDVVQSSRVSTFCSVVHTRAFEHNVEVETGCRRQEPVRTAGNGKACRGADSAAAFDQSGTTCL